MKKLKIVSGSRLKQILITISLIVGILLIETTIRFFTGLEDEKEHLRHLTELADEFITKRVNDFRKTYFILLKNGIWNPAEFPEILFYAILRKNIVVEASPYAPFNMGDHIDTLSMRSIYSTPIGAAFTLFISLGDTAYVMGLNIKEVLDPLRILLKDFVIFRSEDGTVLLSDKLNLRNIKELGIEPRSIGKTVKLDGNLYVVSEDIYGMRMMKELKVTNILKGILRTLPIDILVFSSVLVLILFLFHLQSQRISDSFTDSVKRILEGDSLGKNISKNVLELKRIIDNHIKRLKIMYTGIHQILYTETFYDPKEIDVDRFLFSTFTKYSREVFPTASSFSIFKKINDEYRAIDYEGSFGILTMDTLSKLKIPDKTVRRVLGSLKPIWLKKEQILELWREFNVSKEELEEFLKGLETALIIPITDEETIKAFIIVGFPTEKKDVLYEEACEIVTFGLNLIYKRLEDIKELYWISMTDPLTGIYNRRYFMERLQEEIQRARRYKEDIFSISILDIDDLKRINDNYGHQIGDELIKHIANFLKNFIRESDVVGRIGGDEFGIIWMHTDNEAAKWVQKRLIDGIEKLRVPSIPDEKISISVGTSTFGVDGFTTDELIKVADNRMYEMKKRRKD